MQGRISRRTVLWGAPAMLWLILLFALALMPGGDSGRMSLWVTDLLLPWLRRLGATEEGLHHAVRKLAHFGGFALEGFLLLGTLRTALPPRRAFAAGAAACALFAAANEFAQNFAADRGPSILDVGIDLAGALLGMALCAAVLHAFSAPKRQIRHKEQG